MTARTRHERTTLARSAGRGTARPLALLLAAGVTACAAARPPAGAASRPVAAAAVAVAVRPKTRASAAPPTPPVAARTPFACGPADPEWEEWFDGMFGTLARKVPLTLDPKRLQDLIESAQVEAETMLRRGLQACDPLAVVAIDRAEWRQLMPDLSATVGANNVAFGLQAVVTLRKFGDKSDYSDVVLAALTADGEDDRAEAAAGARFFSLDRLREPLLDRVRRDPAWEVRFNAAESLLDLADVYPRDLSNHPAIEQELRGERTKSSPSPPLDSLPQDAALAPFANAALALDRVIAERLAAGPCPPPRPLDRPRIRAVPVSQGLMALTAESHIGACARQLAFVVFVPSAGGYGAAPFFQAATREGGPLAFQTRPHSLTVDYRPQETMLAVGGVRLDLKEANVAVVAAAGPHRAIARYRAAQDLAFARSGRPDPAAPSMVRFDGELAVAVRTVLDRSPELAAFVTK